MKRNFNKIDKFIQQKKQSAFPPIFFIYWLFNLINSAELFIMLHRSGFNLILKASISLVLPPLINFLWMAEVNFYSILLGKKYKWYENSLFVVTQSFILLHLIIAVFRREYL